MTRHAKQEFVWTPYPEGSPTCGRCGTKVSLLQVPVKNTGVKVWRCATCAGGRKYT